MTELKEMARLLRRDVLEMVMDIKDGHLGPSFSSMEILTALYFGGVLNLDPDNPDWEDRDRFVLSKGHACPALYAALIRTGVIPETEKFTLRYLNSRLQGHPDMYKTPGVEATTGPLGNGLAMAVGMAKGLKILKKSSRVYALTGDGELQEGIIWEALTAASRHSLDNLCILIDHNRRQSGGLISDVGGSMPIREKLEAFQISCLECDGHDFSDLLRALKDAESSGKPTAVICHTVKGKGIDFMEDENSWHKRVPTAEEFEAGMKQLEGVTV